MECKFVLVIQTESLCILIDILLDWDSLVGVQHILLNMELIELNVLMQYIRLDSYSMDLSSVDVFRVLDYVNIRVRVRSMCACSYLYTATDCIP